MKIAVLGLGKMGSRIALKLYEEGHEVVAWNRSAAPADELKLKIKNLKFKNDGNNLEIIDSIEDLIQQLGKPRVLWIMLPAGEATQNVLDEVSKYLKKGDIVIDGGNAYFKDTEKRYRDFKKKNIEYLGIGVSGGILASKNGYPLMVGGSRKAYDYIKPILVSLAKPNGGYDYFGEGGAGHFVKMVHNGIEYGMMQSIGEGFEVLEKSSYKFDLLKVAKIWQKGTIISGFLLDRAFDALSQNPKLDGIKGFIEESGEARWTVEEAKKEGVEVEIIERSLEYRRRSQKDTKIQNSFTAKTVAALRNAFGGHSLKSS
ncbi:MAG: decarboxylating 6-phosphogluconate dehydrogenase [Patescibacteria group bacterium]|nr:decarboxylating 6-phosphogluconate dehydrogenase [Patescibacteria group bacterium]